MFNRKYLLCALLACLGAASDASAFLVDKVSGVVNDDVILMSDVQRFQRTLSLRKELDPLFGFSQDMADGHPTQPKILDFLVQEHLISQSFKVTDAEVETEIQSVQRNNSLDRQQLVEFLKSKGFDFNEYFELMRVGLAKRTLLDHEIRTRVNVSDEDVRNYFYNMAVKNESIPLEYSLQMIAISPNSYKSPAAAFEAAQNALSSIRQGESFAEVAKRVSDDPSRQNGGDIGSFTTETLAEPMRSAVRKLQIGGVSDVLKGANGYIIVKLADAKSTESQRLKETKEQIREQLAKEEYKKQLFLWAERARNNAYVHLNNP